MGAEESHQQPLPPPPCDNFPFFCFSLYDDTIDMIYAGESEIEIFLRTIADCWPPGLDYSKAKLEKAYKIKFKEKPFSLGSSKEHAIMAKNLLSVLLLRLGQSGWIPLASCDLMREWEIPTIIMRKTKQICIDPAIKNLVVVAMSSNDRLHLLNMTGSLRLRNAIKDAISKSCIKIESEMEIRTKNNVQCLELKLEGDPWGDHAKYVESFFARKCITTILDLLNECGFRRLANFNTKTGIGNTTGNADTLFFCPISADLQTPDMGDVSDIKDNGIESPLHSNVSTPTRRRRRRLQRDSVQSATSSTPTSLSASSVSSVDGGGGGGGGGGDGGGESEKRRMFTVALNKPDEILLIDTPKPIPEVVKHVVTKHWLPGLKTDCEMSKRHGRLGKVNGEWHVLVLKESPWLTEDALSVDARIVIMKMMETLLANGWKLTASVDVSRKIDDMTTFIFEACQPLKAKFCCLSFSGEDKIRAIHMEHDIKSHIESVIQSIWLPGVTRAWPFGRSRQWTLNGAVWDNNYYGKCLALHLMYTLYKNEYTLVSSADVSAKCGQRPGRYKVPTFPVDLDTWFFVHDPHETISKTLNLYASMSPPGSNTWSPSRSPAPSPTNSNERSTPSASSPVEAPQPSVGDDVETSNG